MIDWACAAELRKEVGDEDFQEIVGIFLEEADEAVEKLHHANASAGLEDVLHFLKGSALNLGFVTFADLCKDGELMARGGQGPAVDVPAIVACYEASKNQFFSAGVKGSIA